MNQTIVVVVVDIVIAKPPLGQAPSSGGAGPFERVKRMAKKNFTLEETWRLCLSMWQWIAEQVRGGSEEMVSALKDRWLVKNGFNVDLEEIEHSCFFCEYDNAGCADCPARKVDPSFSCSKAEYNWHRKPIAFCNKLVSLNRKRKKAH